MCHYTGLTLQGYVPVQGVLHGIKCQDTFLEDSGRLIMGIHCPACPHAALGLRA